MRKNLPVKVSINPADPVSYRMSVSPYKHVRFPEHVLYFSVPVYKKKKSKYADILKARKRVLIRDYIAGQSANALAKRYKVPVQYVIKYLKKWGDYEYKMVDGDLLGVKYPAFNVVKSSGDLIIWRRNKLPNEKYNLTIVVDLVNGEWSTSVGRYYKGKYVVPYRFPPVHPDSRRQNLLIARHWLISAGKLYYKAIEKPYPGVSNMKFTNIAQYKRHNKDISEFKKN